MTLSLLVTLCLTAALIGLVAAQVIHRFVGGFSDRRADALENEVIYRAFFEKEKDHPEKLARMREVLGLSSRAAEKIVERPRAITGEVARDYAQTRRGPPGRLRKGLNIATGIAGLIWAVHFTVFNYFPTIVPEAFARVMLDLPEDYEYEQYLRFLGESYRLGPINFGDVVVDPQPLPAFPPVHGAPSGKAGIRSIAGFDFYFTAEDADFVDGLDPLLLRSLTDLAESRLAQYRQVRPAVYLCPNLAQFLGPLVRQKGRLNWIPGGYEVDGRIVPWPPSVKKYANPGGDRYQHGVEFAKVLLHEYAHFLLEEYRAGGRHLPLWMEEGSAVYVEVGLDQKSAREQKAWMLCFEGAVKLKRLLSWDRVARLPSAMVLEGGEASVFYVQSYAMAHFLITTFGIEFWKQFMEAMSWERDHGNYDTVFAEIYGFSWQEAVEREEEYFAREVFKR